MPGSTDTNKVEFGISNLYIGTYTDTNGTVTLGTQYHQKGAVNLSLEPDGDDNDFYADNVKYWSGFSDNGFTGEIEVAKFDLEAKKQFFGYVETTGGGFGAVKGASRPQVYVMFQTEGDAQARRVILYNVSLGQINREFATIEDSKEPATETCDITVTGDNGTGLTLVSYLPDDTGYSTLFTTPPVPALKP